MAGVLAFRMEVPEVLLKNELGTLILKEIEKNGMSILDELSKWIQKSIKLRVPRWSGYLAESISARPTGPTEISIFGAPYARAQNEGFTPHEVGTWWGTRGYPGNTIADWLSDYGTEVVKPANITVSQAKKPGFIEAAIDSGTEELPNIIQRKLMKKIKEQLDAKSGRKVKITIG